MKGALQMDYIIAAGLFILVLMFVTQYILSYYSTIGEYSKILSQNGDMQNLINIDKWNFVPGAWPETSSDPSIVFLMHLNNESGENNTFFRDFSGYGNNGTCPSISCPIYNSSGRFNSAYSFDGLNDVINTTKLNPYTYGMNNSGATIETWYKGSSSSKSGVVVQGYGNHDWGSYGVFINNGKALMSAYSSSNTIYKQASSITNVNDNAWHHIAGVIDTANNKISIYVDGTLEDNVTWLDNDSFESDDYYNSFTIGARIAATTTDFINGTIDEVVIYNRSLSNQDILNAYNYGSLLRRIGLKTNAYRFFISVNNTEQFYYNQSLSAASLTNELVSFNYTDLGYVHDIKSTKIYDTNGISMPYQINNTLVTFATNVDVDEVKWFTVYFDDDSSFVDTSTAVTGSNYINETLFPIERIDIAQYRKMAALDNANYSLVKNATNTTNNFRIRIQDIGTDAYMMTLGVTPPRSGNVVALQKYIVFQNATGDIRNGKLIVQVW